MPKKKYTLADLKADRQKALHEKEWYSCRSLFGYNDVFFYILLGARPRSREIL